MPITAGHDRRRAKTARLLGAGAALLGLSLALLAGPRLAESWLALEVRPALRAVAAGREEDRRTLEAAARTLRQALDRGGDAGIAGDLGLVLEALAHEEGARARTARLGQAAEAVRWAIARRPADAVLWARLAAIELRRGERDRAARAYAMSLGTGRNLSSLALARTELGLILRSELTPAGLAALREQIPMAAVFEIEALVPLADRLVAHRFVRDALARPRLASPRIDAGFLVRRYDLLRRRHLRIKAAGASAN